MLIYAKIILGFFFSDRENRPSPPNTAPNVPRHTSRVGREEGGTPTINALSTTLLHDKLLPFSSVTLCYSIVNSMHVNDT